MNSNLIYKTLRHEHTLTLLYTPVVVLQHKCDSSIGADIEREVMPEKT